MRRAVLLIAAAFAVAGLTACMGEDSGDRRAAALGATAAGAEPFQAGSVSPVSIPASGVSVSDGFEVPEGKTLVIEHVSGRVTLPAGQEPLFVTVQTSVRGANRVHHLRKLEPRALAGLFGFGEELTLYADGGSSVGLAVSRASTGGTGNNFVWAVSGHLVDAP